MPREHTSPRWAIFFCSLLIPCLGLFARRHVRLGFSTLLLGAALIAVALLISKVGGPGAGFFGGTFIILPWWVFQAFQSALPHPTPIRPTWELIRDHGHDIRFIGWLFLIASVTDIWIIVNNPEYQLHIFCTRPAGLGGILAKLQSPIFHIAIGYGFIHLLRWSLFVYLVYAGYGILNASVNFACEGFGRIRAVFLISLLLFTLYIWLRRECFTRQPGSSAHDPAQL